MPLCNGYAMITRIIPTGSHYYMVALLCHNDYYEILKVGIKNDFILKHLVLDTSMRSEIPQVVPILSLLPIKIDPNPKFS